MYHWHAVVLPRQPAEDREELGFSVWADSALLAEAEVIAIMNRDGYNTNLYYLFTISRI